MRKPATIDASERRRLCEAEGVTLDGRPAKICGTSKPFAFVRMDDPPHFGLEWSWVTARRIVDEQEGKFRAL